MLPKRGDVIKLKIYTNAGDGQYNSLVHGPMMVVGNSKKYGSNFYDCYMIATGETKTYMISANSDFTIINNALPAAANIVSSSL